MVIGTPTVLNLIPGGVMKIIHVNQVNENIEIQFRIMNGAQPFNVPEGVSCTIRGTKGDNFGYAAAVAVTAGSNIVTVTLTEQLTAVAGAGNIFELVFVGASDDMKVSTENFLLDVERAALGEDTVISDSDLAYADQVLDQLQSVGAVNAQVQQNKANIAAEITRATAAEQTLQSNINAEAAARQAADNTLQSNINAEASSRATTDASLQSQIDQLIAPSGEAPSAAEVENARIGSDGTVYPTLGDAIRTQNSLLKSHLEAMGFYLGSALTASTTANNWALTGTGLVAANGDCAVDKFEVTAGDKLYLKLSADSPGTYQWQSAAYIPTTGTNGNVIGNPVTGAVDAFVQVPYGATYLCVSRKKVNTTNIVRFGYNQVEEMAEDINTLTDVTNTKNLYTSGKKYPIIIDMIPYFWASGASEIAPSIDSDALAVEKYFIVSGSSGGTTLTVDSGSPLSISDLTANDPRIGILTDGNDYTYVSVMRVGDSLTIYPALTAAVSGAYLYSEGVSIHLTEQGYVRYTRDFYAAKKKYCDKSRYIAIYDAWNFNNVPNPMTKIGDYWWGIGTQNPKANNRRIMCNATTDNLYLYFASAGSASNTVGAEWEVDLNYASGYVELVMGCSDNYPLEADLASGLSVKIELILDGSLAQSYTKTTKKVEAICLDFADAKKGKIKITTNSGAAGFGVRISQIAWWVSDFDDNTEKAIDPYGSLVMLMDSWGVYCNNAVQTEYARLVGLDANGMVVPLINNSVGGTTSAWGKEQFFDKAWKEHPAYMLIDFGINDSTQGVTQETYCANMKSLVDAALANGITPIVLLVGRYTTDGFYAKYTLPFISYYAQDVSGTQ